MHFSVPFIALLCLGSKFIAIKNQGSKIALFSLLGAFVASSVLFYFSFYGLVPFYIFNLVMCAPLFNVLVCDWLVYFGIIKNKISVLLPLSASVTGFFIGAGVLSALQAGWTICLITSVIETINSDYIKPLKGTNEFSI